MSQAEPRPDEPQNTRGTEAIAWFLVFVGVAAFLGTAVQFRAGEPSWIILLVLIWTGIGIWLVWQGTLRQSCLLQLLGGLFFAGLCCICLAPHISRAGPATFKVQCYNQMKGIVLALRCYHDQYGCFPPAYVTDDSGRPMHSWRVLILPFMEQRKLYDRYDFSEPWNGPHNSRLASMMPRDFQCPAIHPEATEEAPPLTQYVVVTGKGAAWPGSNPTSLSDITDGPEQTILLVETCVAPVHWMEPRDLDLQSLMLQVNPKVGKGISSKHPTRGAFIALADGNVVFLTEDACSPPQLAALLSIRGGEEAVIPYRDPR